MAIIRRNKYCVKLTDTVFVNDKRSLRTIDDMKVYIDENWWIRDVDVAKENAEYMKGEVYQMFLQPINEDGDIKDYYEMKMPDGQMIKVQM